MESAATPAAPAERENCTPLWMIIAEHTLTAIRASIDLIVLLTGCIVTCPLVWITIPVFVAEQFGVQGVAILTIFAAGVAVGMEVGTRLRD